MTIKGRRIFNYRPIVVFALALIAGIILGEAIYDRHVAIVACLCVVAFLFILILLIFRKTRKFFYIPLALLVGLVGITSSNAVYDSHLIDEYSGTFTATVASEIVVEDRATKFYVSDIRIGDTLLKYDAYVYVYGEIEPDFNAGDSIELSGTINSCEHMRFDTYYALNRAKGLGYLAKVNGVKKLSEGKPKFPINVQLAVKRVLYANNDTYSAGICQALLLGDKRAIDDKAYEDISASGLAHVLAVSGLHISALAGTLYFILKKLKVNPKIALAITTVLTFVYSMLCSFSASSLRAVIMMAVLMSASAFGQKRDSLSSLALASILILIFRPTALMEVGFLLSFYSVLGIIMFYKRFKLIGMKAVNKLSPKRQIGKRFVDVCALSFATNLATLPLVAYFFGRIPTLFVLSNFIVLPYVMFLYLALIVLTLLSLITTVGGLVGIMRFLIYPFKMYVAGIGGLPFATVPMYASVAGIVCFTLLMIFVSRFIFVAKKTKARGLMLGIPMSIVICLLCALI